MAAAEPESRGPAPARQLRSLALKCAVAALLVWWLLRSDLLDLSQYAELRLDGVLLGVLVGQLMSLGVALVRWHLLLRAQKLDYKVREVAQIGLISYFAVILLPATGGQDVVRLYYASRIKPGRGADILATIILDRFLGLLGLCVLGMVSGLALLGWTDAEAVPRLLAVAGVLLLGLGGSTLFLLVSKPRWVHTRLARFPKIASLSDSLESFSSARKTLWLSLALAVIAQFGNGLSMYFGFAAVADVAEQAVSLLEATAITPLVTLTTIVPVTPLGVGVADAAAEGLFAIVGSHSGAEVTMLVRASTATCCLLSGLAYLMPTPAPSPGDEPATPPLDRAAAPAGTDPEQSVPSDRSARS